MPHSHAFNILYKQPQRMLLGNPGYPSENLRWVDAPRAAKLHCTLKCDELLKQGYGYAVTLLMLLDDTFQCRDLDAGVLSELGFLPRGAASYLATRGRGRDTGPGVCIRGLPPPWQPSRGWVLFLLLPQCMLFGVRCVCRTMCPHLLSCPSSLSIQDV
jgi:hypothetical protein